jgi:putative transposase
MARRARLVVPDYPHHVTQRGNRRQKTFFSAADHRQYIAIVEAAKSAADVDILAWCLMPNHVHFVVVPRRHDSLSALFAVAHRRYTRHINLRQGWRGHLWQERFHSCVLDEFHFLAALRYVELNPVMAGLCLRAEEWEWSSARAHLFGSNDKLVSITPMTESIWNWHEFLQLHTPESTLNQLRKHSRTRRPLGDNNFIESLEQRLLIPLKPGKPGPKPTK